MIVMQEQSCKFSLRKVISYSANSYYNAV